MLSGIFDTHAHYTDEAFDEDRASLLAELKNNEVTGIINCATDLASSKASLKLADSYDFIYAACGIHPHEASNIAEGDFARLSDCFKNKKCVAVGEIGLDYHYDFSPRETQLEVFEKQLMIANYLDLPVIIHDREAHEDSLRLLKKYKPRGVMHCFSGSVEMAMEILDLGLYIGLGGAVTFKKAKKPLAVAEAVPLDRLLLETDCPYMTPEPFRGRRNDSSFIKYTADKIAEVKHIEVSYLLALTQKNAKTLFNI